MKMLGLMGIPGAGKSHLARRLSRELGWTLLDRDRIRAIHFPDADANEESRRLAERILMEEAGVRIQDGAPVILDGMTLARRSTRRRWEAFARGLGAEWRVIFLDTPLAIAIRRVRADRAAARHPAGDRDETLVRQVADRLVVPQAEEPALHTTAPDIATIRRWLEQPLVQRR